MIQVKICGIRDLKTAKAAIKIGADFLGFNFVPSSKRYISPADALGIIASIHGTVKIVGVFQNAPVVEVNKIASGLNLDFVQLHGKEKNEYITKINIPVIKFITLNEKPEKIKAKYFLLDRTVRGKGQMVDLKKANQIAVNFPLFYAGGLTPDNVSSIVKQVKPFAVDAAGGIETNGYQDIKKIELFINNAKGTS